MLFDNNDVDLDFTLLNLAGLTKNNDMNFNNNLNSLSNGNSVFTESSNTSIDSNILSAKEGFLRGNLFKNEYKPYKNLTYIELKPKNDREAKLYTVMQYSFAINDLNLWLDLHPNDKKALMIFENMVEESRKAKREYEESYGPLTVSHTKGNDFNWIDSPWPWEDLGGNMYV